MANDLLPCPFCGDAAHEGYDAGNEVWPQKFWVYCKNKECGVHGSAFFASNTWQKPDRETKSEDAKAKSDAAAWWNRRAQPAPLIAERDALAAKLAEAVDALREFDVQEANILSGTATDLVIRVPMRSIHRAANVIKEHE